MVANHSRHPKEWILLVLVTTVLSILYNDQFCYISVEWKAVIPRNGYAVTIFIPNRNREKLLARAILSAQNQTMKNIEIVIVDDASTDNSLKIASKFQRSDDRIQIIAFSRPRKTNVMRVAGIRAARGEFILSLDSDDELTPTAAEVDYNAAIEQKADIIEHKSWKVVDGLWGEWRWKRPKFSQAGPDLVQQHFLVYKINWNLPRKLISRKLWLRALDLLGPDACQSPIQWGEDRMHAAAIYKLLTKYGTVDNFGYIYYALRSDSSSKMKMQVIYDESKIVECVVERIYGKRPANTICNPGYTKPV